MASGGLRQINKSRPLNDGLVPGIATRTDPAGGLCDIGSDFTSVGGSQPHNNMMPYLVLNFIIALQGIFPSQN